MLLEVAIDEKQLKFTTGYDVLSSSKVFLISNLRANEANCAADIKTVKDIIVQHFGPIEIEVTAFKMEEASDKGFTPINYNNYQKMFFIISEYIKTFNLFNNVIRLLPINECDLEEGRRSSCATIHREFSTQEELDALV